MKMIQTSKYKKNVIFRTALPVFITVLLFLGTAYFLFLPYIESSMIRSKREMINELTNNVMSLLSYYHEQVQSGILPLEEAQDRAIARIRKLRYGREGKDYFWINDMQPYMIMHPYRTDLEGHDISNFKDPSGKRLFVEMVNIVKKEGEGYVDYMWQWKDDDTRIVPKTSFVKEFKPWGWIVGTGIYINDVKEQIHQLTRKINAVFLVILCVIIALSWYIIYQGIQMEHSIANQNAFLESLLSAIPNPVFYKDKEMRYLGCNPAFSEFTGKRIEDIIGKTVHDVWIEQHAATYQDTDLELLANPGVQQYEFDMEASDGSIRNVIFNKSTFYDSKGEIGGIVGVIQDITERKQTELSLKKSEDRFRSVIEASKDAMIAINVQGKITLFNPAAEKIFGWTHKELFNQSLDCLMLEEYRTKHKSYIESYFTTGKPDNAMNNTVELPALHRDGTVFPIDLSLAEGKHGEERFILAIIRDINERKLLEEQLQQAQKMEAIGTLAGGIAHDFNNILFAIKGYSELVRDSISDDNRAKGWIDQIHHATDRATELVKHILAYSRKGRNERTQTELNSLIKEVLKLIRSSIPTTVDIESNFTDSSIYIHADPVQIHQVIMNLCTNAYYVMKKDGGILEIKLSEEHIQQEHKMKMGSIPPGAYANIMIKDTGPGISPDIVDRIFDPYFTTKPEGEGTGMGLAVVQGIVSSHGGYIDVMSKVGQGTTFNVYFPLSTVKDSKMKVDTYVAPVVTKLRGKVLVVDDEKSIIQITKERLERIGLEVTGLTDSLEAMKLFQTNPNQFDLVISDQTMPKITGIELSKQMLALRPDLPIILCTGYSDTIDKNASLKLGIREFLYKPVSRDVLIETLQKVLK